MREFDTEYPLDFLFMKVRGRAGVISVPWCEMMDGDIMATDECLENMPDSYLVKSKTDEQWLFTREKMLSFLNKSFEAFLDEKLGEVTDFVIQPGSFLERPEVTAFKRKYQPT